MAAGRVERAVRAVRGPHGDLLLRLVFGAVALYVIISTFDVSWAPLSPKFLALVTIGVLYLFFELALEREPSKRSQSHQLLWGDAAETAIETLKNGSKVNIIASSSATFYYRLNDKVRSLGGLEIRIILRQAESADSPHASRLLEFADHWRSAAQEGLVSSVAIRYSSQSAIRAIGIDDLVIMGHYQWDAQLNRYVGHTVPMVVTDGDEGQFALFSGLFEYLWHKASEIAVADTTGGEPLRFGLP
jgi:hypothetical protein